MSTNPNFLTSKLEYCHKCNAYVPNLKRHTCAKRLDPAARQVFTAEEEARIRDIVREELRK